MSKYFKGDLPKLMELYENSTKATWYGHPCECRGPFNRWLTVSEVPEAYKKHVASQSDDAHYAAAAMNAVPGLVEEIEELRAQLAKFQRGDQPDEK